MGLGFFFKSKGQHKLDLFRRVQIRPLQERKKILVYKNGHIYHCQVERDLLRVLKSFF